MRRPAAPAILTIWALRPSWRASGPVLTATVTAQPEIRRRIFSPHVRWGRRALKRPVSVDCVASTGSSPGAQVPGSCFGVCSCRDWRFCCCSRRGSVQFEISIHRSARKPHTIRPSGHGQEGKNSQEAPKKMQGSQSWNLNLLLGAGKNNRNSLSR